MNMRNFMMMLFLSIACSVSFTFADTPIVKDVSMVQDPGTRVTTIQYVLEGAPGIVTLDILTNGCSIGASNIRYLDGDVNQAVEPGTHTITWRPDISWDGFFVTNAVAEVTAWAKTTPPDYMVVDLEAYSDVRYYRSEEMLPGGITNDLYRTKKLLLRRVVQPEESRWTMGSPQAEIGRDKVREARHFVSLSEGFWIGVFEFTQAQWKLIRGYDTNPSKKVGEDRPVDSASYEVVRGPLTTFYPAPPAEGSFLAELSEKTGLMFDLPSEMQWEYACRGGTDTAYNSGKNIEDNLRWSIPTKPYSTNAAEVARYFNTQDDGKGGFTEGHTRVGCYLPNAWGLYDMHGNVAELCVDYFTEDIGELNGEVNTVPEQNSAGHTLISLRGGGFASSLAECRSASRAFTGSTWKPDGSGFRVICRDTP